MNEKVFTCDCCGKPIGIHIGNHGFKYCDQSCRNFHEAVGCPKREEQNVPTQTLEKLELWKEIEEWGGH